MELKLYSTIEYTVGWYYWSYPGFYNIECYKILADYSQNTTKYTLRCVEESKKYEEQHEEQVYEERYNKKIRSDNNFKNG